MSVRDFSGRAVGHLNPEVSTLYSWRAGVNNLLRAISSIGKANSKNGKAISQIGKGYQRYWEGQSVISGKAISVNGKGY